MKKRTYLLDTNTLIEIARRNMRVMKHLEKVGLERCCISVISLYELYFGAYNAPEPYVAQELASVNMMRQQFGVLPLPMNGDEYGSIKAKLLKNGEMIDEFDILIAATAIKEKMIVVTDNIKHFSRIQGIKIENWVND